MLNEKITIHTTTIANNIHIKYARISNGHDHTLTQQSVLLHRLTPNQRGRAIEVTEKR